MVTWDDVKQKVDTWSSFLKGLKPWKKIQWRNYSGQWVDADSCPTLDFLNTNMDEFRLVDRQLRPYKSVEEFKEHLMAVGNPDGSMPQLKLMLKAFDVEHKDKFYSQPFFIGLETISQCPKDKEAEMFHALYDNATDDEGCPFGVILEDGETFDSDEIPMTPVKTFGELKEGEYLHVLRYCNWLDTYYYTSNRIQRIECVNNGIVDIHLSHGLQTYKRCIISLRTIDTCSSNSINYIIGNYDCTETEWVFTNYFEMKRKFNELKKN